MQLPALVVTDKGTCEVYFRNGTAYDDFTHTEVDGDFTHIVSIHGTWQYQGPPGGVDVWAERPEKKLLLVFDDVQRTTIHGDAPQPKHVQAIIDFARELKPSDRVLVHCAAGISRSTAAAITILATLMGPGRAEEVVDRLLAIRPTCRPHLRMVEMADELLGFGGQLIAQRVKTWGKQ